MGGGGGGDGGARQMEADRQARVQAAVNTINSIFNNQERRLEDAYQNSVTGQIISAQEYQAMQEAQRQKELAAQEAQRQEAVPKMSYIGAPIGLPGARAINKSPYVSVTNPNDNSRLGAEKLFSTNGAQPAQSNGLKFIREMTEGTWRPTQREYFVPGDPANSRQNMYNQHRDVVYDVNRMDVDRQRLEAERANRFALARAGLLGGSANIDSVADMDRRTNEGLMRAGGIADQAAADLMANDERTRASLISLAQSGIDVGTAASQALNGLAANAAQARSDTAGATVGDLFGSMGQAYLMNQMRKGMQAGQGQQGQQWFGVSNTRSGDQGNVT